MYENGKIYLINGIFKCVNNINKMKAKEMKSFCFIKVYSYHYQVYWYSLSSVSFFVISLSFTRRDRR